MITLEDPSKFPVEKIAEFMNSLDEEKKYFLYTTEQVLNSEVLIYEEISGKIIGIAGYARSPGVIGRLVNLPIAYVAVSKKYQGQSIGKKLFFERYKAAEKKYSYLINTTDKKNKKMLSLMQHLEYNVFYESPDRIYFIKPFNAFGQVVCFLLKILFPILMFGRSLKHSLGTHNGRSTRVIGVVRSDEE